MQVDKFINQWAQRERTAGNHPVYDNAIFATIAPEYSTGEVLLGSAYRGLLFERREKDIDLEEIYRLPRLFSEEIGGPGLWHTLLLHERDGIASPIRGGQSKSRLLPQLMPLVPQIAYYACVLGRKGRNRWNPSNLLLHVIGGGLGEARGVELVKQLGGALLVGEDDDIFARFVANAFSKSVDTPIFPPYETMALTKEALRAFRGVPAPTPFRAPAERFCNDLEAVIQIKNKLTRRQWTVLLEAVLRIGLSTHVLWVCYINTAIWKYVFAVAGGGSIPPEGEIETLLWQSHRDTNSLLEFGHDADLLIKLLVEKYVYARFGLNLLFYLMDDAGCPWPVHVPIGYSPGTAAPTAIKRFLEHVSSNISKMDANCLANGGKRTQAWLRDKCAELLEQRPELVRCQDGFTRNLLEFTRYSLGQIETQDPEKRSYDQAYLLANISGRSRGKSRWITQPGPAMLIALVHACCFAQGGIPTSIEDFRSHLADYGLRVPAGELARGQVGTDLEKLGLVVDSPDAAGGRLLVAPFLMEE